MNLQQMTIFTSLIFATMPINAMADAPSEYFSVRTTYGSKNFYGSCPKGDDCVNSHGSCFAQGTGSQNLLCDAQAWIFCGKETVGQAQAGQICLSRNDGRFAWTPNVLHIYVNAKGKDSNSGLDTAHPLLTLQKAHSIVAHILADAPRDAVVHIAPGRYYGQTTRWSFSMPDNTISIQGDDPNNLPVFVGTTAEGQATWMTIARGSAKAEDRQNIQIRNIKVTYYFQAFTIRGGGTNYLTSAGGNLIDHMIFADIGTAFDPGPKPSHAAVFITESDYNEVRSSRFDTITNDVNAPPGDYSNYGGLHAIYVIHSNHTIVRRNKFVRVLARGVIKFRDFSNYGKVTDNKFLDDTSLLMDSYCDASLEVCASYGQAWNECPSWDILWQGNQYKYSRLENQPRPTVDISFHPANEAYCLSDQFFKDRQLDPQDPFNHPMRYYPRYKDVDNKYTPDL